MRSVRNKWRGTTWKLSGYCIGVSLEDDAWQIDYELKDGRLQGGGPRYVIDAETGRIGTKRYEQ